MCTVIVKREMLRQSDIMCSVSKNPNDLRACLKNKYEKLLSYFVTVKFLREPVDMVRSNFEKTIFIFGSIACLVEKKLFVLCLFLVFILCVLVNYIILCIYFL